MSLKSKEWDLVRYWQFVIGRHKYGIGLGSFEKTRLCGDGDDGDAVSLVSAGVLFDSATGKCVGCSEQAPCYLTFAF